MVFYFKLIRLGKTRKLEGSTELNCFGTPLQENHSHIFKNLDLIFNDSTLHFRYLFNCYVIASSKLNYSKRKKIWKIIYFSI